MPRRDDFYTEAMPRSDSLKLLRGVLLRSGLYAHGALHAENGVSLDKLRKM